MTKTFLCIVAFALAFLSVPAFAETYVRGYTRSDGTYVAPHYRSSPDSSYNNNWSVTPNVNPYTFKYGTESPTFNNKAPTYDAFGTRRSW